MAWPRGEAALARGQWLRPRVSSIYACMIGVDAGLGWRWTRREGETRRGLAAPRVCFPNPRIAGRKRAVAILARLLGPCLVWGAAARGSATGLTSLRARV